MRIATVLTVLGFAVAGCEVTTLAPPSPQSQPTQAVAPQNGAPSTDRAIARAFVQVVEQLEPVAERECRSRSPRANCDFLIVVDDRPNQPPNAFQTVDDDGRPIIAFTLALIADAQNIDEIAFVMAHEAAHHIENHLEQQQRNATLGAAVFGQLAGVTGSGRDAVRTAQELGAVVGVRSFSKDFELEADRLGTIITARAGYDPVLGSAFFNRIPDPGDRFLGTHPANADRVRIVRETAAGL